MSIKLTLEQTMQTQRRTRSTALFLVIAGFRREIDENCALLCCYAASSGNLLPTFVTTYRSHIQGSRIQKMLGRIGCPENSEINYHYSLHNNPEERSSQLYSFFNLGARRGWLVNVTPRLFNSREINPVPTVFLVYVRTNNRIF